jgi:hypothetical protein
MIHTHKEKTKKNIAKSSANTIADYLTDEQIKKLYGNKNQSKGKSKN